MRPVEVPRSRQPPSHFGWSHARDGLRLTARLRVFADELRVNRWFEPQGPRLIRTRWQTGRTLCIGQRLRPRLELDFREWQCEADGRSPGRIIPCPKLARVGIEDRATDSETHAEP